MAELQELLARDEKGRFASVTPTEPATEDVIPKETPPEIPKEVTPPIETPPPVEAVPVVSAETEAYKKAMREEREKRQNAERQLREFQQKQSAPVIDPYADLPGSLEAQKAAIREDLFVERCNLTEEIVRDKHQDYDEVRDVFLEAAQDNPALMQQMRQERNPAAYAYREGLRIKELKDVGGDFSAYRAKIEKATEERIRKEYADKAATHVPASLNSDSSPPLTESYSGPKSLKEILKR